MFGSVKWWNEEKGFGFIIPDEKQPGDKDIFVHYSEVVRDGRGRVSLAEGQRLEFDAEVTPKGTKAVGVKAVA